MWVEARFAESDAPFVAAGRPVRLRSAALPAGEREARIAYVYPALDDATRTLRARLELDDPDGALRPGAWVELLLRAPLGERLQVPTSALLQVGARRLVFVQRDDGRLEPRDVSTGVEGEQRVETCRVSRRVSAWSRPATS